ncbi:hypothetical protein PC129_g14543 [Phytophthora cactorum]|uniref:Uncharacterized protein n=1 Tax=Phytophthora cactorum TaxID=29920 RepID=A0A329RS22_9STRA|nr:hypothetical protein Pcac1_g7550 [Phytophthora cactorum]KAG2855127.1 hypothetical protein PC113_g12717 [Phytophthora cactorum]KAG2878418.1 hypothetical protein PC114_g23134 [Phytophthora cactorum]KAG2883309.1 hypothetical protein PC115_g21653 [Phytophthora cactorum]KAG2891113.1 hypothetical protein PC117_g24329 [Phytophthora cactorum]
MLVFVVRIGTNEVGKPPAIFEREPINGSIKHIPRRGILQNAHGTLIDQVVVPLECGRSRSTTRKQPFRRLGETPEQKISTHLKDGRIRDVCQSPRSDVPSDEAPVIAVARDPMNPRDSGRRQRSQLGAWERTVGTFRGSMSDSGSSSLILVAVVATATGTLGWSMDGAITARITGRRIFSGNN